MAVGSRQVQMNTRIDAELKHAGDVVLARLGHTPSSAVRGLWRYVVERQDDVSAIREVIEPERSSGQVDEASRRQVEMGRLRSLYRQTSHELGVSQEGAGQLPTWEALRDAWYEDRLGEGE